MSRSLEQLTREAREDMGRREVEGVDWDRLEARLLARVEQERRAERARFDAPLSRGWTAAALLASAAAIAGVLWGKGHDAQDDAQYDEGAPVASRAAVEPTAGRVVPVEGEGAPTIQGASASAGAVLHLGDVIEARGTPVTVERPGKLTFRMEAGSRAVVTHVDGALVLALDRGAVEAQVVPVPNGEAFAVDVGASRVAVHGTHLRVARVGEHVTVDLSEGVISVGEAPRAGDVLGALVTAPAHAEFAAGQAPGTMSVTHDPAAVRPPLSIVARAAEAAAAGGPVEVAPAREASPAHPAAAARSESHASQGSGAPVASSPAGIDPGATIATAVKACMAEHPYPENVTVLVSTVLHLDLGDDGAVRAARFDPPVAPDVNGCASPAIYRARFAHGGSVSVPIDFRN
jgi:ferric-dicitrate binding protein FerR (iron transport regulator)